MHYFSSRSRLSIIPPRDRPHPQLHPQRCAVEPRVLDDLDGPRDLRVALGVRLAVGLHLAQRGPERLPGGGRVPVLQVLVVAQHEARGVHGELEREVGPLEVGEVGAVAHLVGGG